MSVNPTSFRLPFSLPEEVHPAVRDALRLTYQGVADLNQAIAALVPKVNANTAAATTINETITASTGGGGGGSTFPVFGNVSLQPNRTAGAYTFAQTDLAGLILVNSSIAFALTLNSGLTLPFFATVYNFGAGGVTATPSTGLVNNAASVSIAQNQFAIIYFDGANWWAAMPTGGGGGGPNFADDETPTGAINGSNTAFSLAHSPSPVASLQLYWQASGGASILLIRGNDYTLSGANITMLFTPATGDILYAYYRY